MSEVERVLSLSNVPFESASGFCVAGCKKSSLIDSISRGSTWKFCPRKVERKQRTRVSKTRVLIRSRVSETRDAIITNCSESGQLTKLLPY